MIDMFNKKIYLILGIILGIVIVSGSTYAWLTWSTSSSQQTTVVFTATAGYECAADGGGNITSNNVKLIPTTCDNAEHTIKRTIKVMPTINKGDSIVSLDLWLDVKSIGSPLSSSENFKYVLTTNSSSCTSNIVSSGNFKGKTANSKITLLNAKTYNSTTTDTYYLYIWLDNKETNNNTMNQSFNLSLNGNCSSISG